MSPHTEHHHCTSHEGGTIQTSVLDYMLRSDQRQQRGRGRAAGNVNAAEGLQSACQSFRDRQSSLDQYHCSKRMDITCAVPDLV